jgi:FkbM family methyltransferase
LANRAIWEAPFDRISDRARALGEILRPTDYLAARRFAKRYGVSLLDFPTARRANLHLLPLWCDPRDGLVLDIGANEGSWTMEVLDIFPHVQVIAAEPGPEPLAILSSRFDEVPNVTIDPRAISDSSGVATFHRTRASVFASLLPPSNSLHERYDLPGGPTDLLETFSVQTATLDELVGERTVSLMKLDVQGGEMDVLKGGAKVLERTAAILIEVVFVPHYEGDATFPVLHEELAERGFELFGLGPVFRLDGGPALWADACYCRPDFEKGR